MKIRKLSEVKKTHPNFKPGWRWRRGKLENPKFGSIEQIAVCKDDETPAYDSYQISEVGSAIIVPYYRKGNTLFIGLIDELRSVVKDKNGNQGSMVLRGVPRGFKNQDETGEEAAIRELGEETRAVVKKLTFIGMINPNTSFYTTSGIPAFKAEVDPEKISELKPDAGEKIIKSQYYPIEETLKEIRGNISKKETNCGMSLSALFLFFVSENLI